MKLTYRDIKLFCIFFINGGILGLFSYFLQNYFYHNLNLFLDYRVFMSSFLAMVPILFLNFIIQLKIIFRTRGRFLKFLAANFLVLLLISIFTEISARIFPLTLSFNDNYYSLNFIFVSLLIMPLSFFLKRNFVFIGN